MSGAPGIAVDLSQLPLLLRPSQLRAALGYGRTKFWALKKAGAFTKLEAGLPGTPRYSREKVRLWLAGELPADDAPRLDGRRFLAMARKPRPARASASRPSSPSPSV